MQDYIDLLGDLSTGVIAVATIVLVYVTWNLARVSKRSPFVMCYLESSAYHPRYVNFVVMNTGDAPAFNIKANVSPAIPDIYGKSREGETESNFSVLVLPPNRSFPIRGFNLDDVSIEKFDITVSWYSKSNGGKPKILTHSMSNRSSKGGWGEKGLDRIAREFEKTTKHLEKIEKHLKSRQDKK